ncbi:hypothetical protein BDF20DRAFT_977316 [Mycotypha africana]|uniref:uncharacterized protein n=1 Tax=Mycotypha africana TaxID=64632 RepID=UPI0023005005|nr:uncharacterized protein BDF20DRAFT_977316 [Mycotypha africana]KAI8975740.1 hypothetical protein BDF20DRAFT_977316 [Mycotypha africana]
MTTTITTASTIKYASPAAILQINDQTDRELFDDSTTVSSLDSFHDIITPMELGSVMSELQASVSRKHQEQEDRHHSTLTNQQQQPVSLRPLDRIKQQQQRLPAEFDGTHNKQQFIGSASANQIVLKRVDPKAVQPNTMNPREQEIADELLLTGIRHLFSNRFMKAKSVFEEQANTDPAYALGLGFMSFMKAMMSTDFQATKDALQVLTTTCNLATAQINNTTKKHMGGSIFQHITSYCKSFRSVGLTSGFPVHIKPSKPSTIQMHRSHIVPNGILRAHIANGEASLQMAILYLVQQTSVGYIKSGVYLKKAYTSYSYVWQEYKRLGQLHNQYMDRDTMCGMQVGIASIHLILSALPRKILDKVSPSQFKWKPDRHLGFALLKLSAEIGQSKTPTALLTLLAYFTTTVSICPEILASEYLQPAIETLLEAQKIYPHSAMFLYFAGLASRIARNLVLSTQSLVYAIETSKAEWMEVEVFQNCSYEIAFNHMMKNEWKEAAVLFEQLYRENYWSPIVCKYLAAACTDMLGHRTEAMVTFADVLQLISKKEMLTKDLEFYIQRKLDMFQSAGYQDMDMTLCALEYMYLFNAYEFMDEIQLEQNLAVVDDALDRILEAEIMEYKLRAKELLPETPPPAYYDQRGVLLLLKAAILNAMRRYQYSIIHLNWILDHIDKIMVDKWIIPYAYWEAGVTSWNTEQKPRARYFWETALTQTGHGFENRVTMKVHLALTKAQEMNIQREKITKRTTTMNLGYMHSYHPPSLLNNTDNSAYSEHDGDSPLDYDKSTIGTTTVSESSTTENSTVHPTMNVQAKFEEEFDQADHALDELKIRACNQT